MSQTKRKLKTYTVYQHDPSWVRYIYEVQARSAEDAVTLVMSGELEPMGPGEIRDNIEGRDSDYQVEEGP